VAKNVFLISDTHFGHEKTCTTFKREDGSPLRPFANANEMDEFMVAAWNDSVKPTDKVYHLGDVVIDRKLMKIMHRLNGDKVLIRGNHDIFKLADYAEHFRDIRGYHVMNGIIMSHIPLHEESLGRFGCNIHGHLHGNRVMKSNGYGGKVINPRYHSVCVEKIDFCPILFEDVMGRIKDEGGDAGFRPRSGDAHQGEERDFCTSP